MASDPSRPITLAHLARQGVDLVARCNECGRSEIVAARMLAHRLGDELPLHDIAGHFRCAHCGSRRVTVAIGLPNDDAHPASPDIATVDIGEHPARRPRLRRRRRHPEWALIVVAAVLTLMLLVAMVRRIMTWWPDFAAH